MHVVYSPRDKDFEQVRDGLWFKRVIEGEDESFRAGYAKRRPADVSERVLWMDEFLLCVKGRFKVTVWDLPFYKEAHECVLKPGDVLFQGRGSKIRSETLGNEPTVIFYVAIPSSTKGTHHTVFPPSSDKLASITLPVSEEKE